MKISVITINLNNAIGLAATMESVIMQTYEEIEYIVIDGNSSDGSRKIIEDNQRNLAYWISEPDKGIYHAMNKGIAASTGEYLLFINSGDRLYKRETISLMVREGLTHDLVYGNLIFVNLAGQRCWIPPSELTFETFYTSTIPHPATFIKRSLFTRTGLFDESLSIVSDWKFFLLSVCKENCTYKHINWPIAYFNEEGICSSPANFNQIQTERDGILKKHFPAFLKDYSELLSLKREIQKVNLYVRLKKKLGMM